MTVEQKFTRAVEPDDPRRCQGSTPTGQCPYLAMTDTTLCPMHGGVVQQNAQKQQNIRNYRIAKWQDRLNEFADSDKVKSLREEIGMLRIILEEIWTRCIDSNDVIIFSNKIMELTAKLEKLVSSCHRLEQSTGMLLDKTQILHLAQQMVEIIGKHVTQPDLVDAIANEFVILIAQQRKVEL